MIQFAVGECIVHINDIITLYAPNNTRRLFNSRESIFILSLANKLIWSSDMRRDKAVKWANSNLIEEFSGLFWLWMLLNREEKSTIAPYRNMDLARLW